MSWSSSVSIVSGYELDNHVIEVRSPAEAKEFSSSLYVQTGSGVHTASYTVDTGGGVPFSRAKVRLGCDANHSPPSSAEVRMSRSYTSPPMCLHGM
jgi:hypothetical protein